MNFSPAHVRSGLVWLEARCLYKFDMSLYKKHPAPALRSSPSSKAKLSGVRQLIRTAHSFLLLYPSFERAIWPPLLGVSALHVSKCLVAKARSNKVCCSATWPTEQSPGLRFTARAVRPFAVFSDGYYHNAGT